MRAIVLLTLFVAAVSAVSSSQERIVGGSVTTINNYPSIAALLHSSTGIQFYQSCAGIILNQRSILTAAECFYGESASRWRVRLGSTRANSDGWLYNILSIHIHENYNRWTKHYDIAMLHLTSFIAYNNVIQAAQIAGELYVVPDGELVRAVGWGRTSSQGLASEDLRHVDLVIYNQASCRRRYLPTGRLITSNSLCVGWIGGGRGQCKGDVGGPVYHNNVAIGIYSFSHGCGIGTFPSINTRINNFLPWILANA